MTPLTIENWRRLPATLALLLLSLAGFFVVYLAAPIEWVSLLTFSDFELRGRDVVFVATEFEFWRFLTPIFLHFSWMHIVFNSLWLWELGGKLELLLGSWVLLLLVIVLGVASNSAQFWYGGPSLFGGMSGVVYGLLGFNLVLGRLLPLQALALPNGIVAFMLGWLVFCMIGPTEMLGFGSIANAAHLAGLVGGVVLGIGAWGWMKS